MLTKQHPSRESGVFLMRRIPTLLEFTISAVLSMMGLYLLSQGSSVTAENGIGVSIICGAVFLAGGGMLLISFVRSAIRHWKMLRGKGPDQCRNGVSLLFERQAQGDQIAHRVIQMVGCTSTHHGYGLALGEKKHFHADGRVRQALPPFGLVSRAIRRNDSND